MRTLWIFLGLLAALVLHTGAAKSQNESPQPAASGPEAPPLPPELYENLVVQVRGLCVDCHEPRMLSKQLNMDNNAFFQALIARNPSGLQQNFGQRLTPSFIEVMNAVTPHMGYYHFKPASMPDSASQADNITPELAAFLKVQERYNSREKQVRDNAALRAKLLGDQPLDGKLVFDRHCAACHRNVAMIAAPQIGDLARWKILLRGHANRQEFYDDALYGEGAMPARGGVPTLTDEAVKAAVDYLLKESSSP